MPDVHIYMPETVLHDVTRIDIESEINTKDINYSLTTIKVWTKGNIRPMELRLYGTNESEHIPMTGKRSQG